MPPRPTWTNRPLADFNLDPEAFRGDDILRLPVLGVKSYVRRVRLEFTPMDVYIVIPCDDILTVRNRTMGLIAFVLGLILLIGGTLFCKVIRRSSAVDGFSAGMPQADDITILALRARGEATI